MLLRTLLLLCLLGIAGSTALGDEVPRATLAAVGLAELHVTDVDVRSDPWQFHWGPCDTLIGCRCEPPLRQYTLPTLTFLRRRLTLSEDSARWRVWDSRP